MTTVVLSKVFLLGFHWSDQAVALFGDDLQTASVQRGVEDASLKLGDNSKIFARY